MTPLEECWRELKFVSDVSGLNEEGRKILLPIFEEECRERKIRRVKRLLKCSGIKRIKLLEDFDWKANPKLSREEFMSFARSKWIDKAMNLILIGPAGVGKTHLATGLCYKAIQDGHSAAFISSYDLVSRLKKRSQHKDSLIQYYSSLKVFCLDELGYLSASQEEANDIFQIISKRSEIGATLVTTNLVPSQWGKIFEAATATAILDRLNMNGVFLTLEGKSYRTKSS
jgi:DNA replication protein DnaC